jgi:argininosuccinate lyase
MPQKKNSDAAELIRGKSGRVYGNLVSLLTLMKSLPLAYNKDLQEDKEPIFDTVDTAKISLSIFNGMIKSARFKKIPLHRVDISGFLTATDMADYLAEKGVPFRLAHEITGQTVAYCIDSGKTLQNITFQELKNISPQFDKDIFEYITLASSVQRKNVYGGTAKKQVVAQIGRLDKKLRNMSTISRKK